ncbi:MULTISPECIES: peroxiredoxin [Methylomonas]|uniref:thioredoxin-dependent peroxiredoxin n=2 Tax=Methylomonas TaxID=416 RepID=A0A140E744_9GAMM|nr:MULTISPECIES: peroxiredoxin [Methylomonas]AMK79218.1 AhpC/TSA family antioxidant protein [Methylomonas denitrificans]OAH98153.1 AhpC/TSA family antioxidant protein [Methylomonas methanica]TCV86263.1 peroxiredoxin [Methylomonas methanica]
MKNLILKSLLPAVFALPVMAALPEGHPAPDFQAQASLAGKAFNYTLEDALKKGPVVVYFYPSAYTGGCNLQAHSFAVNHEKFAAAGASIVGVSLDSIERLNDFSADPNYCASKFPVASDADGKISGNYDIAVKAAAPGKTDSRGVEINHGFAERTTFVVTPNGKIAATLGGLKPEENVAKALEIVEKLAADRSKAN